MVTPLHYCHRMESKIKNFDGSGDIKAFLEKVKLQSALKGYEDQKAAQYLASRLEGQAFDVYMRLSDGDKGWFPYNRNCR